MKARLRLYIGPDAVRAFVGAAEAPVWAETIPYVTPDDLRNAVSRAADDSRRHRGSRRVTVSIDCALLQQRSLSGLPPVTTRVLRSMVARGTGRFFRQNGHALVSDAMWTQVPEGQPRIAAAIAFDGLMAESIVDGAKRSGLLIEEMVPEKGPGKLSLLPENEQRRRRAAEWSQIARLAGATAVLWLAVLTVLGARLWVESRRVNGELAQLAEPRDALIRAHQAMESATAMVDAINQANARRQATVGWLARIANALPDSAYFEEVKMDANGAGSIKGVADEPRAVFKAVQGIPGIGLTDLQTGAGRDSANGAWQEFTVTFEKGAVP